MKSHCPRCGEVQYDGACTWCHEEVYIAAQYEAQGESVPQSIADKVDEQMSEVLERRADEQAQRKQR